MYRFMLTGLLALAIMVTGAAQAADDKPESIGDIMKKAHSGENAFRKEIAKNLKVKDFDAAATTMKAWSAIASHLNEFEPPKGSKESWKKMTKKYADSVKALAKTIDDKNVSAATKQLDVINKKGCGGCHSAHKGK